MKNNSQSDTVSRIKSSAWRDELVDKIQTIPEFVTIARQSRNPLQPISIAPDQLTALNNKAAAIITAYDKQELAAARHYYNNEHLLEYWRFYNTVLNQLISNDSVDSQFPLYIVNLDYSSLQYNVSKLDTRFFEQAHIFSDESNPIQANTEGAPALPANHDLRILFRKLTALNQIHFGALLSFYNLFILKNAQENSHIWAYYLIHYFLDNNLYQNNSGEYYKSHFDSIFFNSNIFELKAYLAYMHESATPISVDDVRGFLKRQRDHNVKRALVISMEENEIGNRRKDLLKYNPEEGIVSIYGLSDELLAHYHNTIVKPFGLIKQTGCPFAKSKGISRNSVVEVFGYFDNLMLSLLEISPEFTNAFRQSSR